MIINFLLWLFVIRPYCFKRGKAYTPGASIGVTMWIDWQEAKEMADERGDRWMVVVSRIFLGIEIVLALFVLVAVLMAILAAS